MPQPCPALSRLPVPADPAQRLALVALRRMAAHGIRDAHVATLFLTEFGLHFRKPLVLLRGFMVDVAQVATRTIQLAPCCALRMTRDEARLLSVLASACENPAGAAQHLCSLCGSADISAPFSTASAFHVTMAQLGRPLAR